MGGLSVVSPNIPIPRGLTLDESGTVDLRPIDVNFMETIRRNRIGCLGAGYVGAPTMAIMAKMWPEIEVHVCDVSEERINAFNKGEPPFFEPGLKEVIQERLDKNLFFTTDCDRVIRDCDIIFVCVNTPTKSIGIGAGMACDLSAWESCGRSIAASAKSNKIVIEKSTVPVRTAAALQEILLCNCQPDVNCVILSCPEFMAEGTAIRDLLSPERVLIGGPVDQVEGMKAVEFLVDLYKQWVPNDKILTLDVWSSELSKLVGNAFLAQRVSSINSISHICEVTGADISNVARCLGKDSRVGPKFLQASCGFGGSCFRKDILSMVYICECLNLPEVAEYWSWVVRFNEYHKNRIFTKVFEILHNTIRNKRIAVFGFAFKKDTADTRDSSAITVCARFLEENAIVHVVDPEVSLEQAKTEIRALKTVSDEALEKCLLMTRDPMEATLNADCIVVLTEWDCFKEYNYPAIYSKMRKPAAFVDTRRMIPSQELYNIGFNTYTIGEAPRIHRLSN